MLKKIVTRFFFLGASILSFVGKTSAQIIDTADLSNPKKMDSLASVILDAHRTFLSLNAGINGSATTIRQKNMLKRTDSIFQARRAVINSLFNNVSLMSDADKKLAVASLNQYLTGAANAKKIAPANNSARIAVIQNFSNTMKNGNLQVSNYVNLLANNSAFEVRPDNFIDLKIKFEQVPANNYTVYLFPFSWKLRSDFLATCYTNDEWQDIARCGGVLERYAKRWTFNMQPRIRDVYSGRFILLIVNRAVNKVVHFDELIVPLANTVYSYVVRP